MHSCILKIIYPQQKDLIVFLFVCFLKKVSHGLIRLVGGENAGEGRVEIFHQGVWGTICGNHWTVNEANVICRELGYARSLSFSMFSSTGGVGRVCQP